MADYRQHLPLDHDEVINLIRKRPTALPNWILMGSFIYYQMDETLYPDTTYDLLIRAYKQNQGMYADHRYAHLFTEDRLNAGSFYDIAIQDYPRGITNAAINLMSGMWDMG